MSVLEKTFGFPSNGIPGFKNSVMQIDNGSDVKYQGREFTTTIQANSEQELDILIDGLREYSSDHGMEQFKIINKGPDQDGGWEATIKSHNSNIGKFIKSAGRGVVKAAKSVGHEIKEEVKVRSEARRAYIKSGAGQKLKDEIKLEREKQKTALAIEEVSKTRKKKRKKSSKSNKYEEIEERPVPLNPFTVDRRIFGVPGVK